MGKLVVLLALGAVALVVLGSTWLAKKRWGRWAMFGAAWALATTGVALYLADSVQSASYWGDIAAEDARKIAYQREVLRQMQAGLTPATRCPYSGWDAYHCYCVDEAEGRKHTTTNAKRKRTPAGLYCLDAAGLESEIRHKRSYLDEKEARVDGAHARAWASVVALALLLLSLPVGIVRSRKAIARERAAAGEGPPGALLEQHGLADYAALLASGPAVPGAPDAPPAQWGGGASPWDPAAAPLTQRSGGGPAWQPPPPPPAPPGGGSAWDPAAAPLTQRSRGGPGWQPPPPAPPGGGPGWGPPPPGFGIDPGPAPAIASASAPPAAAGWEPRGAPGGAPEGPFPPGYVPQGPGSGKPPGT